MKKNGINGKQAVFNEIVCIPQNLRNYQKRIYINVYKLYARRMNRACDVHLFALYLNLP